MFGLLGSFFILFAWMIETMMIVKRKRNPSNIFVTLFFFIGVVSFAIYSIQISDIYFIVLNLCAAIMIVVNLCYIPRKIAKIGKEVLHIERVVEKDIESMEEALHLKKHKGGKRK